MDIDIGWLAALVKLELREGVTKLELRNQIKINRINRINGVENDGSRVQDAPGRVVRERVLRPIGVFGFGR